MRKPSNSINRDTTEKPYVSEDYSTMNKSITNKEVEDVGVVVKHSEFEKPYRLSYNQDYMDMQTQHPSNFDFPYITPSDANFENPLISNSIRGIGFPGMPPNSEILDCIKICSQYNSVAFCVCCCEMNIISMPCDRTWVDKANIHCQEDGTSCICDGSSPIEGSDEGANGNIYSISSGACITFTIDKGTIEKTGVGEATISNIDSQCGTATITTTDVCGNTQKKEVRMPNGFWSGVSLTCPNGTCSIGEPPIYRTYRCGDTSGSSCSDAIGGDMSTYHDSFWNQSSDIIPFCPYAPCGLIRYGTLIKSRWIC